MIRYVIIAIVSFFYTSLLAQTPTKDINNIKRDSRYIWAEATEDTKAKAEDAAKVSLTLNLKEHFSSLDLETIKSRVAECKQIHMARGDMHRVFVFIPKDAKTERTADIVSDAPVVTIADSSLKEWQHNLIGNLMKCTNVDEVVNYMDRMKIQNKVTQTGTKSTQPRNPLKAFYVFFDNSLNTNAILGKEENGKRMNYMTNKSESIKDYSRYAYIWFVLPN